tara:strand:+ start:12809 stop:13342 length:534 start_codon:yes stop_codon:yes gene_type:complete
MAITTDLLLKGYFTTGSFPTSSEFDDFIDSKLVKTGASAVKVDSISEETTDNGVQVENTKFQDNLISQGVGQTQGYVMRMYEIGAWDMNRSASGLGSVTVVLDGALKSPESVSVLILKDTEDGGIDLISNGNGGNWVISASGDVTLSIDIGSTFDSAIYDGATNRGFVVVTKWTTLV